MHSPPSAAAAPRTADGQSESECASLDDCTQIKKSDPQEHRYDTTVRKARSPLLAVHTEAVRATEMRVSDRNGLIGRRLVESCTLRKKESTVVDCGENWCGYCGRTPSARRQAGLALVVADLLEPFT